MKSQIRTTEECLRHYLSSLPWGRKGCIEARQPMMNFMEINPAAIRFWYTGEAKPAGMFLLRLRFFLEQQGYKVAELESLKGPIRQLGRLIVLKVIDKEAAFREIGVDRMDHFVSLLLGNIGTSLARLAIIEKIVARHQDDLERLKDSAPIQKDALTEAEGLSKKVILAEKTLFQQIEEEIIHLLRGLDSSVSLLAPRLERLLSSEISVEQRRDFREKAGRQLVFDLSNKFDACVLLLNALCSEKSREIFQNNQS